MNLCDWFLVASCLLGATTLTIFPLVFYNIERFSWGMKRFIDRFFWVWVGSTAIWVPLAMYAKLHCYGLSSSC